MPRARSGIEAFDVDDAKAGKPRLRPSRCPSLLLVTCYLLPRGRRLSSFRSSASDRDKDHETQLLRDSRRHAAAAGGAAGGRTAPFVTLRLRTDDGIEGIGYAGFVAPVLKALKATVDALAGLSPGADPRKSEALESRLSRRRAAVRAAISQGAPARRGHGSDRGHGLALWDIEGNLLDCRCKAAGGAPQSRAHLRSGELWHNYTLDQSRKQARLIKEGYKAMKFRLGSEPTQRKELERVKVMREAVGPDVEGADDRHQQSWTVDQAINIGRGLGRVRTSSGWTPRITGLCRPGRRVADALGTSVCAGEYHFGVAPAPAGGGAAQRRYGHGGPRAGAPGISGSMKVGEAMAETFNLPMVSFGDLGARGCLIHAGHGHAQRPHAWSTCPGALGTCSPKRRRSNMGCWCLPSAPASASSSITPHDREVTRSCNGTTHELYTG